MPKFIVTLEERATYQIEIEADTAEAAAEIAEETFVQSDDIKQFACEVLERDVVDTVRLVDKA